MKCIGRVTGLGYTGIFLQPHLTKQSVTLSVGGAIEVTLISHDLSQLATSAAKTQVKMYRGRNLVKAANSLGMPKITDEKHG